MSSERAAAINPLLLTNTMMGQTPFADPVKMDRQDAFSIPAFDALQKFADRFELRTVLYFTLGVHIITYTSLAITAIPSLFPSFPNSQFVQTIQKEDMDFFHYLTDQPWYYVLQIPVSMATLILTKLSISNTIKLRLAITLAVLQVILGAAATTFFIYIFNDRIVSSRKCAMACLLWESPEAAFCPYTVNETTMSAYGMVNRTAECGKVVSDKNLGLEPANCLLTFPQYVDHCIRLNYQDIAEYRVTIYSTIEVLSIHPVFTFIIDLWVSISAMNSIKME